MYDQTVRVRMVKQLTTRGVGYGHAIIVTDSLLAGNLVAIPRELAERVRDGVLLLSTMDVGMAEQAYYMQDADQLTAILEGRS